MILIADSGSSKTDWAILTGDETQFLKTEGLNPRQKSQKEVVAVLSQVFSETVAASVEKVLFFGAGCSGVLGQNIIKEAMATVFPVASVDVYTDLHGAAIGLFGTNSGIAAILGTGANCGYWDGTNIVAQPTSLGYLLGDEGSGFHIGKLLAEFYLKNNMPAPLAHKFEERFALTPETLIATLYQQLKPNVFLAGLSVFAFENRNDSFIVALLNESFGMFFRDYITKLPNASQTKIKFTGSIASIYENELKNVAWKYGCQVCAINQSPIQGIAEYFKTKLL